MVDALGVTVIVLVLIIEPTTHQSASFVFGHRANNSTLHGGFAIRGMYWFLILPIGFLLTMYTFTGYDASAHLSEETHDAERAAPPGLWRRSHTRRSAAGSCCSRSPSLPLTSRRSMPAAAARFRSSSPR